MFVANGFFNEVQRFTVFGDSYVSGQVGLRTWRTQGRFDNVHIVPATPKCFVIMPFASDLNFMHRVINEVVESYGIECERADEIFLSRPVMDDVKRRLAEADVVIVDFTGKNPNVHPEAGIADAFKQDWIALAPSSEDVTFDVWHIRSRYPAGAGCPGDRRAPRQYPWQYWKCIGSLFVPDQRPPQVKPQPSSSATRAGSMSPGVPIALVLSLRSKAMPQLCVDGLAWPRFMRQV